MTIFVHLAAVSSSIARSAASFFAPSSLSNFFWCAALFSKRKPSTELYVNGNFTEDREEWQQELLRHCEGVYTDPDETRDVH